MGKHNDKAGPVFLAQLAARRRRVSPLATIRAARTLTQYQLAALVGVTQQQLQRWEKGGEIPPPDRRAQMATLLGTTSEVLWPPVGLR